MTLEILTPDKTVFQGEATSVTVPGVSGAFEILNNHAPIISTLQDGKLIIRGGTIKEETFIIKGGVVEAADNKVTVLAEGISH